MSEITNEVLAEKMDGLKDLFNEKFQTNGKEHGVLVGHQKTTNGRVNRLEAWKSMATGAFLVVNLVGLPIIFILIEKYIGK